MEDQTAEKIYNTAMAFAAAIEGKDTEAVLLFFADDCRLEVLGQTLNGKDGARRWINWLYHYLNEIAIDPVTTMQDGNTFFEEYILRAKANDGTRITSKQAQIMLYENLKIKSLRVYFDRFDFADLVAKGFMAKTILREINRTSLKGLS